MIDGLAPRRATIEKALTAYRAAEDALRDVIRAEQDACPHLQILHADWQDNSFGYLRPLRICVCCGLEEEGTIRSTAKSWHTHGPSKPVLGNEPARLVIPAEREDIYALRLPGARHLTNRKTEEEQIC